MSAVTREQVEARRAAWEAKRAELREKMERQLGGLDAVQTLILERDELRVRVAELEAENAQLRGKLDGLSSD